MKIDTAVIIATCNRYEVLMENIKNIRNQDYPVKIYVGDDSDIIELKKHRKLAEEIKSEVDWYEYTALYDHERNKIYGLGRARNMGIINCKEEYLVILDDRITPDIPNMIAEFVKNLKSNDKKVWYFGNKGADKKSFVENCSAVRRKNIIAHGMFPETINQYGFMTKEVHERFSRQGFEFTYLQHVMAKPLCKGSSKTDKRDQAIISSKTLINNMYRL